MNYTHRTTIDIDELIKALEDKKAQGAKIVILNGKATLLTDHSNSVLLTTEPQM